ncbi:MULTISPECIES: ferritin family protein [Gordonia]|jgi:hypothetical protein|uniref:ferritin-like domain-containing protein n=1 Tax=Gordonia TaxID=2053 RepID=UPI001BCCA08D|nr:MULTISPECIES: ferritin-like domain-containing protein [Gordonia]
MDSSQWLADFRDAASSRVQQAEPDWAGGSRLTPGVARSLQRFQVGESGDGRHLIAKAAASGDADYADAVLLFVAEEQNHARMLAELLRAGGYGTVKRHWSDTVFVRLRRALGLRLEVMVLAIAEVIALRYYRALADGDDALLTDVAQRILDDEHRHVPFQVDRLRAGFGDSAAGVRWIVEYVWRAMALVVTLVVALDHGPALREVGVSRRRFVGDTARLFAGVVDDVFTTARHTRRWQSRLPDAAAVRRGRRRSG